jgi:hypothetical protein
LEVIEAFNGNAFVHFDSMPNPGCEGGQKQTTPRASCNPLANGTSKNPKQSKGLGLTLGHGCVLFVQHSSKNALHQAFPSSSFVACAFLFSDCERATEGGIPRSSRF